MTQGEVYKTRTRVAERGNKPGYYVVVSRSFIADNDDVSTVICAPVYSRILGISTEVVLGESEGIPRPSAARCDFLMLMFKAKLTEYVGSLGTAQLARLDHALAIALGIPRPIT